MRGPAVRPADRIPVLARTARCAPGRVYPPCEGGKDAETALLQYRQSATDLGR